MRKINIICYIIIVFVFFAAAVNAYQYNITHSCPDNICVRGSPIEWSIEIINDGHKILKFNKISLFNRLDGSNVTKYIANVKDGVTGEELPIIELKQGYRETILISDRIPANTKNNKLIFYPCFNRLVNLQERDYVLADITEILFCEKENLSIEVIDCINDVQCKSNEICDKNECSRLKCGECEYAYLHKCVDYECCSSSSCKAYEQCANNTCKSLQCADTQIYLNNTCSEYNCTGQEVMIDHSCVDLGCAEDETIMNKTCIKLECNDDEYVSSHNCLKLECLEEEGYMNNSCYTLQCEANEKISNHQCVLLNCGMFEDTENHACIYRKEYVTRFAIEIIVLCLIIALFVLDIIKVKKKYKNSISGNKAEKTEKAAKTEKIANAAEKI